MSNFLISSDLRSSFSFSLSCSVFSDQACVQADTANKIITISETQSPLKCCFSNCTYTVRHHRFEWIFGQILIILTDLQTLPSHTDCATAFEERSEKHSQSSAEELPESQTRAPGGGCQGDAQEHHRGSEANLVSPWRTVKAHCHLWAASSIRSSALPRTAGAAGRRSRTARALLAGEPLCLRDLHWHPSAGASGQRCLVPARPLRTEPLRAALRLQRACLLGAAKGGQQLWSVVSADVWSPCGWLCTISVL